MAPVGITVITLALWLPRPAHLALQNHKHEPRLSDLDGALLQWQRFDVIASNVAKRIFPNNAFVSQTPPYGKNLLRRKCSGISFRQPSQNRNRNRKGFCPADQSAEICMDETPGQMDAERQPWRDKDKMSFSIAFAFFFFIMHGQIFNPSTNYLSPDTSCICLPALCATSPPLINLFFLITSGNWKAGSLVTAAHRYISLPLLQLGTRW